MRRRPRRNDELPLHARELVSGHAAEIDEVAGLGGAESNRRARAFSGHARRFRILVGKDDIVLGTLAIDQGELDHLTFRRSQQRIDLPLDCSADADIDHAALGNARAQCVLGVGDVTDVRVRRALPRLVCCGGLLPGCRRRRRRVLPRCARCGCGRLRAAGRRGEKRNHVGAVVFGLETRKRHLVPGNHFLRIGEIGLERLAVPDDIRLLQRRRIGIAGLGAGFSADDGGERWAEDILAGFERVARLAFSEHEPPGDGIAAARGARAWCRRRLCARL